MRRGEYANFDPSKLLPGEWAVVQDGDPEIASGKAVYMCFAAGDVRRLTTIEDLQSIIADLTDDVIAEIRDELNTVKEQAQQAATSANAATATANTAADTAGQASERATAAAEAAEGVVLDAIPTMTANIKGGAKLGDGLRVDDDALSIGNLTHFGSGAEVVTDGCAIYIVDGEGWAEQDGTPTPENPQEIKVARGRNLIQSLSSGFYSFQNGAESTKSSYVRTSKIACEAGTTYVFSASYPVNKQNSGFVFWKADGTFISSSTNTLTVTAPANAAYIAFNAARTNSSSTISVEALYDAQLELGSTPTPYVPYGHVGLEVTHNGTTTVTPIPLPSKGFAASLPDGTADTLAIDSAGRWEWTNASDMYTVLSTEAVSSNTALSDGFRRIAFRATSVNGKQASQGVGMCSKAPYSTAWKSATNHAYVDYSVIYLYGVGADEATVLSLYAGAQILYTLATPTTESGYIDLPDLPEGATVSIPELKQIGVSWFVSGAAELVKHAENWHKREDLESRVEALEAAIAELATS